MTSVTGKRVPSRRILATVLYSKENRQMAIHLTFDIDWAPDWSIYEVLDLLEKAQVKATFFCTHPTKLNKEILRLGHNLGIHPNFLSGTTQGSTTYEIIEYLLGLAPNATCMRTHALVQSSPLLHEIFLSFPQLKYDFSLFTAGLGLSKLIYWNFDGAEFWRINYQWEDDACFWNPDYSWTNYQFESPHMVMDFHPIHVSLNSMNLLSYQGFKRTTRGKPMSMTTRSDAVPYINDRTGTRDALNHALQLSTCIGFEDLLCELAS